MEPVRPRVLVLAGRDPTGGAGLDADREACEAAGADAVLVATADTDQDGRRVFAVRPREPSAWLAEARAAAPVAALKTGLLPHAEAVRTAAGVARAVLAAGARAVVVDPVLAASGGERFLDDVGIEALLCELVPAGVVLTPNLPEAARLAGEDAARLVADPEARVAAARALLEHGAAAVVLKGGHADEDPARDLLLERGAAPRWLAHPRVAGASLHGSGCRHASFLAARLAAGDDLPTAAAAAGAWLARRIAAASAGPS